MHDLHATAWSYEDRRESKQNAKTGAGLLYVYGDLRRGAVFSESGVSPGLLMD
jgi:hypothetical protein